MSNSIYIGLGANLSHPIFGSPRSTLEHALTLLSAKKIGIKAVSPWYKTTPIPLSDQPDYVNAVAEIETALNPAALLACLQEIELFLGRVRSTPNAARAVDLDILAYGNRISEPGKDPPPHLPHPRMESRAFVLLPLRDLAPTWVHPKLGKSINELIFAMPSGQGIQLLSQSEKGG